MADDCRRLNRAWALTIQGGVEKKKLLSGAVQEAEAAFQSGKTTRNAVEVAAHALSGSGCNGRL
jgi:hypothetical protein